MRKVDYCLPIITGQLEKAEASIVEAAEEYRYFEIWLDYLSSWRPEDLVPLANRFPDRLLFLFRRQRLEPVRTPIAERRRVYELLGGLPAFLDLDIRAQKEDLDYIGAAKLKIRTVLSFHDYDETPPDSELKDLCAEMLEHGAYVSKIATACASPEDAARLLRLGAELSAAGRRFVVLGMGEEGKITRVAGAIWGSYMTFAPRSLQGSSAPGQLTRARMQRIIMEME